MLWSSRATFFKIKCLKKISHNIWPFGSIGWEPQKHEELSIDEYEGKRLRNKCVRIPAKDRIDILENEWQAPLSLIMKAIYKSECVRTQRLETMNQTKRQQKIEEALESTCRNLNKLSFKKNTKTEIPDEPSKKRKLSKLIFRSSSSRGKLLYTYCTVFDLDKMETGNDIRL